MATTVDWKVYQERYRNSVVQICMTGANHKLFRPYQPASDFRAKGTGFFIDAKRGLVMTNNHVVSSATSISCRVPKVGKIDLRARTIAMTAAKDLALCQIYAEDLELLRKTIDADLSTLDLRFGDSLKVKETDPCMVMGYPHGMSEIKMTIGTVSGFNANVDDNSDLETTEDSPSYLQVQAPINPGNSGGPLFNTKGEVIGVVAAGIFLSQSTGFAIPSRTVQGVLAQLLSPIAGEADSPALGKRSALIPRGGNGGLPYLLQMPRVDFEWNQTNPALVKYLGLPEGTAGILVTKVQKDSCLIGLEENDFISTIDADITTPCDLPGSSDTCKAESIVGTIDDFGDVSITSEMRDASKRKMALKEVLDMLPIGNTITLGVWRGGTLYKLSVPYIRVTDPDKQALREMDLHYEPLDWEVVGGLVFEPLTFNYIDATDDLEEYAKGDKRYQRYVVVVQVLPGTEASRIKSLRSGLVVKEINGVPVHTLEELRTIVRNLPLDGTFVIKMVKGQVFAVGVDQMRMEDTAAMQAIEMPTNHPYILDTPAGRAFPSLDVASRHRYLVEPSRSISPRPVRMSLPLPTE